MRETVELSIPFESLIGAVEKLNLAEKRRLWELLEEQLAQADEAGATGEGLPPHLHALLRVAGALKTVQAHGKPSGASNPPRLSGTPAARALIEERERRR
jgi:hypothetical protein